MKYLKKLNESNIKELDKEFLDMVFVEFLDNDAETTLSPNNKVYTIELEYEMVTSIGRLQIHSNKLKEDALKLEEGMNKVKIEYPRASYTLNLGNRSIIFKIYENSGIIRTANPEGYSIEDNDWDGGLDDFFT